MSCCFLCDFPSFGWCPWNYRRFWILCWIKCLCIGHDILLFVRYAYIIHYYIVVVVFLQFFFIICYRNETTNSRRTRLRFRCPSITTCSYQAKTFLPYWIKRYIFFQNVELEPLYNFDEAESVTIDFL